MRITPVHAGLGLVVLLATAACGGSDDTTNTSGKGPIAVEATDTACKVERSEAAAGTIQFTVRNTGSTVNDF
jgi:iron uptake system component EfeO